MLVNPAWFLRAPLPIRRIWRRPVEPAAPMAPAQPVASGGHLATAADETPPASDGSISDAAQHFPSEPSPLAAQTLAGLTALRAADAEVAAPALLAGAKAHGPIDQAHLKLILQHLDEVGATDDDRRYVLAHLTGPPDMQAMFDRVHDLATAQEAYEMAATMIDTQKPAERDWLAALRRRLGEIAARFR